MKIAGFKNLAEGPSISPDMGRIMAARFCEVERERMIELMVATAHPCHVSGRTVLEALLLSGQYSAAEIGDCLPEVERRVALRHPAYCGVR